MHKNLFAVFAYFSHSVVLKSSTSLFWLTAEHSKKVIIRLVGMNTNSAGLITQQLFLFYPPLSSYYFSLIFSSLSKEVKFKLKMQSRNVGTSFFFFPVQAFLTVNKCYQLLESKTSSRTWAASGNFPIPVSCDTNTNSGPTEDRCPTFPSPFLRDGKNLIHSWAPEH